LAEYFGFFIPVLIVLGFYLYSQFEEYRRRVRFLEVKIDALIKHTGIEFDDRTLLPVEVHKAIKAGQRLKAIRLYRKITGAGLKEASEIVDSFVKNT
jgi:ribosomal protein L7/L12